MTYLKCPKCQVRVATQGLLTLFTKRQVINCESCGGKLVAIFNERMLAHAILSAGVGWFVGLVVTYGVGYPGAATSVAGLVGILVAAISSYKYAFRLSELK